MKTRLSLAFATLVLVSSKLLAQNGTPLDASVCFSDLLRNHYDFTQNVDLRYRLFSLWNQDLYEASKEDNSVWTPYGGASYGKSTQKILRELQVNNQSIDYNKVTAIHVASLDKQAAGIINHCLDRLTSGYGVSTKVDIEDARYLNLTIYWRSPENGPLRFRKQQIFNGIVLDDNRSHPSVPLAASGWLSRWFDPQIPSGSSRTIRVERTGPYDRVKFSFTVSPDITFEDVFVEPAPEKVVYVKTQRANHPVTDQAYQHEWVAQTWVDNNGLKQTYDDGHGHKHYKMTHEITDLEPDDPTAVFTYVHCYKYGSPQDFADLDGAVPPYATDALGQGAGTREAICSGWWQESGRSMKMSVQYQTTDFVPQTQRWQAWQQEKR
jgi:hypothetical protein